MSRQRPALLGVIAAALLLLAACTSNPDRTPSGFPAELRSDEPYAPMVDPADFVATIDNPYFPLLPGTRWVMEGEGHAEGEVTTTQVTSESKTILGVVCTVVRDEVTAGGELRELTFDWYAQDKAGNVWYFGEDTAAYQGGDVVSTAGAWEAGVDGAQPGIIMPADPVIGLTYRQEFYEGEAEDMAKAVELGASAETPADTYADVLVTEDWTPLEPSQREHKFYAPGIGLVMEQLLSGGGGFNRLVEFTPPG